MAMGVGFMLTPHKISMCILLQASHLRHTLSLFLLDLSKSSDYFLEPSLEELGEQLRENLGDVGNELIGQLANKLQQFTSPDDLFTFVLGLRDLLAPAHSVADGNNGEDDSLLVEQNSILGQFLRRCILSFNHFSFEETCRLVRDLDIYRQCVLHLSVGHDFQSAAKKIDDREAGDDNDKDDINSYFEGENLNAVKLVDWEEKDFGANADTYEDFTLPDSISGHNLKASGYQERVQDGGFSFAFGADSSKKQRPGLFLRSYGEIEAYIKEQADLIERQCGVHPMGELTTKLVQLAKLAPELHRVHYLQYLHCLQDRDYPSAMDNLHRYFDYSAGKGGMVSNTSLPDASIGRFQAALLSLGATHARFGHVTQALQALNESLRIAQQDGDDSCLIHTLASLCHLLSEVGVSVNNSIIGVTSSPCLDVENGPSLGVQQQLLVLLKRCLRRAHELRLPHLVAFSCLALAKFDLKHARRLPFLGGLRTSGLGTSPVDVNKTMKLSPYLLSDSANLPTPYGLGTPSNLPGTLQRPVGTTPASVNSQAQSMSWNMVTAGGWSGLYGRLGPLPASILQLAGTSFLLKAASWELYGSSPMVRMSSLTHAICYGDVASADDLSLAYVNLVRHLAAFKGYASAFAALDIVARKFSDSSRPRIRAVQFQLIHERALYHGDIKLAEAACTELGALASPIHGVDMEVKIDFRHRHAQTLLAAGQFREAASVAQSLFCICYESNMQLESITVLLLIADIHKKAGSAVTGLPYALASLVLSRSFNLDLVHATAMITLSELWLGLGANHAEQALALVHQCMPIVLGHGKLELRGRTYLTLAHCYLSNTSFSVQTEHCKVMEALDLAAEDFELLEDYERASEAFYLKSLLFNAIGNQEQRDIAAGKFREYTLELSKAQASKLVVFSF